MNRLAAFAEAAPEGYFLDTTDHDGLTRFLRAQAWIDSGDAVCDLAPAGEGNMNCTLRVTTGTRTFILKQSRPWVEKYPDIAAPVDRALQEGAFYEEVAHHRPVAQMMPELLGVNRASRILMLADLGPAADYTGLYRGEALERDDVDALLRYLSELHAVSAEPESARRFVNRDMRRLNHHHIFEFPLLTNAGFDLDAVTAGLQAEADRLRGEPDYVAAVTRLGDSYLADGRSLLHGDFFPGSWVRTEHGLRVIDPEFCFFGPPEFDVGVLLAHLYLSAQTPEIRQTVTAGYRRDEPFDEDLAAQFAGVEMMRRLLGVAQLPLPVTATLTQKRLWLERSRQLVCGRQPWRTILCDV